MVKQIVWVACGRWLNLTRKSHRIVLPKEEFLIAELLDAVAEAGCEQT